MALRSHSISRKNILRTPFPEDVLPFFLLIFPFFKTEYMGIFPVVDLLFNLTRILAFFCIVIMFLVKRQRFDAHIAFLLLMELCLLGSTLLNDGSMVSFVKNYAFCLAVYLLVDYYSESPHSVVSVLFFIGELFVYANLLSMLLYPGGLYVSELAGYYRNWILGYKNQFFPFFLCFACVALLRAEMTGRRCRSALLLLAMLISLVVGRSSTALAAMLILIVGAMVARTHARFVFDPYFLAVIVVTAFALVVFAASSGIFDTVASLLNRDATFSGRTIIWTQIEEAIAQKPLFGWGVLSNEDHIAFLGSKEYNSAHNYYLELIFSGGLVAFGFYLCFMLSILKSIRKFRGSYASNLLAVVLFALGIAYLAEVYFNPILFVVFGLSANVDKFVCREGQTNSSDYDSTSQGFLPASLCRRRDQTSS